MKTLTQYLTEGHQKYKGYWDEFEDEDTGEVIKIYRSARQQKKWAKMRELEEKDREQRLEKVKPLEEKKKKLSDEWWKLFNDQKALEEELSTLSNRQRELYSDMEQEVGSLMHKGDDAAAEDKANEYGGEMNDVEEKIDELSEKIDELEEKMQKIDDELMDLQSKIDDILYK